ncbi:hypothetical protein LMH73_024675 [Vibrio splendidus]|nr:hypothetical protein [Vibrio splendidus]MCC4880731.1 hypothetical protein [Vibrio splendidus]
MNFINTKPQFFIKAQNDNYIPTNSPVGAVFFNEGSILKLSTPNSLNGFSKDEIIVAEKLGFGAVASVNLYGDIEQVRLLSDDCMFDAGSINISKANEFNLKRVYHGTNRFFNEFNESTDIGFHFGNKSSALSRLKVVSRCAVTIEKIEYGKTNSFQDHLDNIDHPNALDRAFAVLMTRLSSPRPNLMETLKSMAEEELVEIIDEYMPQPLSSECEKQARNAGRATEYSVCLDDVSLASFTCPKQAKSASEIIKKSMLKEVDLSLINPIRLPDLGLWSAYDIAILSGFDANEVHQVMSCNDPQEQYSEVIKRLEMRGYDGIIYRNEVENAGSDSFIVFHSEQILDRNSYQLSVSKNQQVEMACA